MLFLNSSRLTLPKDGLKFKIYAKFHQKKNTMHLTTSFNCKFYILKFLFIKIYAKKHLLLLNHHITAHFLMQKVTFKHKLVDLNNYSYVKLHLLT